MLCLSATTGVPPRKLIRRLDQAIASYPCALHVLLVDDGSAQGCNSAIGPAHIDQTAACDAVLVMDADGEDTPDGALQLVRSFSDQGRTQAIFAERSRRVESILFRIFYRMYKGLHRVLTGISVRVGNFSILPRGHLSTIVTLPELWNHYAAVVFRSGLPLTLIPIPRGYRIAGKSRMNFVALVTHGLSAISVFGDIVGVRLLIGSLVGSLLAIQQANRSSRFGGRIRESLIKPRVPPCSRVCPVVQGFHQRASPEFACVLRRTRMLPSPGGSHL